MYWPVADKETSLSCVQLAVNFFFIKICGFFSRSQLIWTSWSSTWTLSDSSLTFLFRDHNVWLPSLARWCSLRSEWSSWTRVSSSKDNHQLLGPYSFAALVHDSYSEVLVLVPLIVIGLRILIFYSKYWDPETIRRIHLAKVFFFHVTIWLRHIPITIVVFVLKSPG